MHPIVTLHAAWALHDEGWSVSAIARRLDVPVSSVRRWCRGVHRRADMIERRNTCPRCHGVELDEARYAYLLGQYLGDGHLTVGRREVASLSIFCSDDYPDIRSIPTGSSAD